MKFYTYGNLKIDRYSIWPTYSAVDVCEDYFPHAISHRWYQLVWLNIKLNLDVSTSKSRRPVMFDSCKFFNHMIRFFF